MIIARENLSDFCEFIKSAFGVEVTQADPKKSTNQFQLKEHARFMLGEHPFFIRDIENDNLSYFVEIVSTDHSRMEKLEAMWGAFVEGADICTPEIPDDQ